MNLELYRLISIRLNSFLISLIVILSFISQTSYCQSCKEIIASAKRTAFKENNYELAIKKLLAISISKDCEKEYITESQQLITKIYSIVNQQRILAENARKIAEERALIISKQKDSLQNENIANITATNVLQKKEINPTEALKLLQMGLCFSPSNASLLEIRKKLLEQDKIMENLNVSSNRYVITCIEPVNDDELLTTGDGGYLTIWDIKTKTIKKEIKLFNAQISDIKYSKSSKIVYLLGNDNKNSPKGNTVVKSYCLEKDSIAVINRDSEIVFSTLEVGNADSLFVGDNKGNIWVYSPTQPKFSIYLTDSNKIIGLKYWQEKGKLIYSTFRDLNEIAGGQKKTLFTAPSNLSIKTLEICSKSTTIVIGIGSELFFYDYASSTLNPTLKIHNASLTACSCADSTGEVLTTSLDGNAVVWNSNGQVKYSLKGSPAEIYSGYISNDGFFAITAGRRPFNNVSNDTTIIKLWSLKGFLVRKTENAHLFGVNAIRQTNTVDKTIFSAGQDGNIMAWDANLNSLSKTKISKHGISAFDINKTNDLGIFGTDNGELGSIQLKDVTSLPKPTIWKSRKRRVSHIKIYANIILSASDNILYIDNLNSNKTDSVLFDKSINYISSVINDRVLLAVDNKVILFSIKDLKRIFFEHKVMVSSVEWLNDKEFVSLSGQFLRRWRISNNVNPTFATNNNIQNSFKALSIDTKRNIIYTSTWKGYIIAWNFEGKQLFFFNSESNEIINDLHVIDEAGDFFSAGYNGDLMLWKSPYLFLEKNFNVDCQMLKEQIFKK